MITSLVFIIMVSVHGPSGVSPEMKKEYDGILWNAGNMSRHERDNLGDKIV